MLWEKCFLAAWFAAHLILLVLGLKYRIIHDGISPPWSAFR